MSADEIEAEIARIRERTAERREEFRRRAEDLLSRLGLLSPLEILARQAEDEHS